MIYNIPIRRYCGDKKNKKMVSMRLPERLFREIQSIAKARGWELTDLVMTVLDQFAQSERRRPTGLQSRENEPKKMTSMRLPELLMKEIKISAEELNMQVTELVVAVVDQFAQSDRKWRKK